MVSTIHSRVNKQGVGEYHQFYDNELESAEKDSTMNWSWNQSKGSPAQWSGSGVRVSVVNVNGLGAVIRGLVLLLLMIARD
jgi:hypothetical protein